MASVVAYSAWWVTGLAFLALERSDDTARFHAAQSVVVFGTASAVIAFAYAAMLPLMLVSSLAVRVLMDLANVVWLGSVAMWAWLIFKAAKGERWVVPGFASAVPRLAGRAHRSRTSDGPRGEVRRGP
ncbi:MAG: hypothetical protein ABI880_08280 [Acidobacteriota bacterium]